MIYPYGNEPRCNLNCPNPDCQQCECRTLPTGYSTEDMDLVEALWLPEGTAVFVHNGKITGIIKNIG